VVYFDDPALMLKPTDDEEAAPPARREPDVILLVFAMPEPQVGGSAVSVVASTALFGGDLNAQTDEKPLRFGSGSGVRLARQSENPYGCDPSPKNTYDGDAVLAIRGECTFLEKLVNARNAGASGVVVISDQEHGINPSANAPELHAAGDLHDVAIVVVTKSDGELVTTMMDSVDARGKGEVQVAVERVGEAAEQHTAKRKVESGRLLHINGHPLLNTRLLV
jgi:ER degradation enhancer, mannosidase alpha-like 1